MVEEWIGTGLAFAAGALIAGLATNAVARGESRRTARQTAPAPAPSGASGPAAPPRPAAPNSERDGLAAAIDDARVLRRRLAAAEAALRALRRG